MRNKIFFIFFFIILLISNSFASGNGIVISSDEITDDHQLLNLNCNKKDLTNKLINNYDGKKNGWYLFTLRNTPPINKDNFIYKLIRFKKAYLNMDNYFSILGSNNYNKIFIVYYNQFPSRNELFGSAG